MAGNIIRITARPSQMHAVAGEIYRRWADKDIEQPSKLLDGNLQFCHVLSVVDGKAAASGE